MPQSVMRAPAAWRGIGLLVLILLSGAQPALLPIAEALRAAQAATANQDYAAAADALTDAAARLPYAGYAAYRAGLADVSAQRYAEAVAQLQTAAALSGWTPTLHTALGDAYLGQGLREAALEQWNSALAEKPQDDGLLARLANSYEALNRYPEAIAALRALAQVRGNDAAVYYRLALLTAATEPAQALSTLALVAGFAPSLTPTTQALQQAIETGQASGSEAYTFARVGFTFIQLKEYALAELALSRAVAAEPSYADAYAYLGFVQDMQEKDGLAAYEIAVKLAPESPLALFFLGRHWRLQGEASRALTYLEQAQKLDSQNPALAAELGAAYASQPDLTNAEIWYVNAVTLDERNPEFWLLLARFYVDNNYHLAELGLPAARMAVNLAPDSALAADALGYALVLTNDLVNGQKMLERALTLDANVASVHLHLGWLNLQQGHPAEARAEFQRAIELDNGGPYGQEALRALAQYVP